MSAAPIFVTGVAIALIATGLGAGTLYMADEDQPASAPAEGACPFGPDHWINNPAVWPVSSVKLGGQTYNAAEIVALLKAPTGDASVEFGAALATLRLNAADGRLDKAEIAALPPVSVGEGVLNQFGGRLPLGTDPATANGATLTSSAIALRAWLDDKARTCLSVDQEAAAAPQDLVEEPPVVQDEAPLVEAPEVVPEPVPAGHTGGLPQQHVPAQDGNGNQSGDGDNNSNNNGSNGDNGNNGNGGNNADQGDDENDPDFGNQPVPECDEEPQPCDHDAAVEKISEVNDSEEEGNDRVDFQLRVRSIGNLTVHDVVLWDELPDFSGTWVVGGADGEFCTLTNNRNLTCEFGDMPSGSVRTVVVSSALCEIECGPDIVNTAKISASDDEWPDNNEDSAVVPREDCPGEDLTDVTVDKEANTTVGEGQNHDVVEFTFLVENIGDDMARNVTLRDELPDFGSTWELGGDDADFCQVMEENGVDVLTCEFGDLLVNESRSFTVTSGLCDIGCGEDVPNTVTVSADNDENLENNEDTAFVDRPPCGPDVSADKTVELTHPNGPTSDRVNYTIVVRSIGEETARNVTLEDSLPNLDAEWILGGEDAGDCDVDEVVGNDTLTCSFGDMDPGEKRRIWVRTTLCEIGCGDEPLVNKVNVSADEDKDLSNNEDTASIDRPACGSDAEVDKEGNFTQGDNGTGSVNYTLTVTGSGEEPVENVVLTDELPDLPTNWTVSGPDAGSCILQANDNGSDTLTCDFGDLHHEDVRQVFVTSGQFTHDCGQGPIENTASIESDNDANAGNDEDTAFVNSPECGGADAMVEKRSEVSDNPEFGNDTVRFNLTVESVGIEPVTNVTLHDSLPDYPTNWTVFGPDAADCILAVNEGNDTLTCTFGTLDPGETRTVVVESEPFEFTCDDTLNTASITSDNDEVPQNDQDTVLVCDDDAGTPGGAGPDVVADKQQSVAFNNTTFLSVINYTLTVESVGGNTTTNVTLNDTLPAINGTWEIANTTDAAFCTLSDRNVSCEFGNLNVTEFRQINVLSSEVSLGCGQPIVNTMFVNATNEPENNTGNNNDTVILDLPDCPPFFMLAQAIGTEADGAFSLIDFTAADTGFVNSTTDFFVHEEWLPVGPNQLKATLFESTIEGDRNNTTVHATAEALEVQLVSEATFQAEFLRGDVVVTCEDYTAESLFVNVKIGSTELSAPSPPPNTAVPFGLGTAYLNYQVIVEEEKRVDNLTVVNRYVTVIPVHIEDSDGNVWDFGYAFAGVEGCVV